LLVAAVLSFGVAALCAVGFRDAPREFTRVGYAYFAALALMTAAPTAIASVAPRNFWMRLFYAGATAGIILAVRRLTNEAGLRPGGLDLGLALAWAAAATGVLALGAPLWRGALRLSLPGLFAAILGAAGGVALIAIEANRTGAVPSAGASLAFAAGAAAAVAGGLSAAYARAFALGGDSVSAAAAAARDLSAPAAFAILVGSVALGAGALFSDAPLIAAAYVAFGAIAIAVVFVLFLQSGALALKTPTEATAVEENRRRASLAPFLRALRAALPPSTALSMMAILIIVTVVSAFEATPASFAEIALVPAATLAALIAFVSLRTALMLGVMLVIAGRLCVWGAELAGVAPAESARIVAFALAAFLFSFLLLGWRDNRNPRRKAREVTQMALADRYFQYVALAVFASASVAASDAAGLWSSGSEAALFAAAFSAAGFLIGPPLMTATGALFGRT
jgi:hypothetical protein